APDLQPRFDGVEIIQCAARRGKNISVSPNRSPAARGNAGGVAMAEKPYDRLDGVIWYDGKLVPWGEATLHVLSHGLHYASSVFEGERAYGGEIFKCTEHSQRLKRSAELLDFDIPYSVAEIDAAKRLVLEKN